MDRLPRELIDAILRQCISHGKATVLSLRTVCKMFDDILKPYGCRTLQLEFSRLSKASARRPPRRDALQTIGYHCKAMYIDLMVLRDELEVEFLDTVFAPVPSMKEFCRKLQRTHCMNDSSFTELDYRNAVEEILFNCRDISRLRLNLPFQLVGRHCNAGTMILAISMDVFARRPDEDSAMLKVLVLENLTDIAVCNLWTNPSDVRNIMIVMQAVEHLVMTVRRHETERHRVDLFSAFFWDMVHSATRLKSLCIHGLNGDDRPPQRLRETRRWTLPFEEWRARALPAPQFVLPHLTSLELKRVDVTSDMFESAILCFGATLEEIFLNEVYLQTEHSDDDNRLALWVGLPNQRPTEAHRWIAMMLRESLPRLRVCRASFLGYDNNVPDHWLGPADRLDFDFDDPCGRGRSMAQRFVEVAQGVRQPRARDGGEVVYLPRDPARDHLLDELRERPLSSNIPDGGEGGGGDTCSVRDYDSNAYQLAVDNPTSCWHKAIDGVFPNCNKDTLDELHAIAETACQGMSELNTRDVVRNMTPDDITVWHEVVSGQL